MILEELLTDYARLPEYLVLDGGPVSVNTRSGFGNYPINIAAARGRVQEVALLLENGADVNQLDEHGYTSLHEAVEQVHHEIVLLLIKQEADTKIENDDGDTALDHAKLLGKDQIAKLL